MKYSPSRAELAHSRALLRCPRRSSVTNYELTPPMCRLQLSKLLLCSHIFHNLKALPECLPRSCSKPEPTGCRKESSVSLAAKQCFRKLNKICVGGIPNSKEACICKVSKSITTFSSLKHCGKIQSIFAKNNKYTFQRPKVHFESTKVYVQSTKYTFNLQKHTVKVQKHTFEVFFQRTRVHFQITKRYFQRTKSILSKYKMIRSKHKSILST